MPKPETAYEAPEKAGRSRWEYLLYAAFLVCVTLYFFINGSNAMQVKVGEENLTLIDPAGATYQVRFDEILSLETQYAPDFGTCVSGEETETCRYGAWRNDAWGEYTLCALSDVDQVVVVKTQDKTVVFNVENSDTTKEFYSAFQELLAQRLAGA